MTARRRRARRVLLLGVVALLFLAYALRGRLLPAVARFLDVSEPPEVTSTDFILPLEGDEETRPFVAAALYRAGLGRRVLLTKPRPSTAVEDGQQPTRQDVSRQVLTRRGVPEDAIFLLEEECVGTADEASALAHFLEQLPPASVTIVTNAYHTRRAKYIFDRALRAERGARIRYVAAPNEDFDETNWWVTEHGLLSYLYEYVKLPFYLVRY